jgi:hypothetical protein
VASIGGQGYGEWCVVVSCACLQLLTPNELPVHRLATHSTGAVVAVGGYKAGVVAAAPAECRLLLKVQARCRVDGLARTC